MHTVSPSANINRFPGIYSYCMRVFKASLAFLPAPEVKFGAWVLRDVKSHPVRTITCPCLLPSFLFLCCPAKAVRAKMKHSAVLNIPSMTVLMTEIHNPKLCVSCAPLGPWSCVRAHGAVRFPGGNPWEDVPSLESRECERGIWGHTCQSQAAGELLRPTCFWVQHHLSFLPEQGDRSQGWAPGLDFIYLSCHLVIQWYFPILGPGQASCRGGSGTNQLPWAFLWTMTSQFF